MKSIQENFLEFIENEEDVEEKFENLNIILNDIKIHEDKNELRLFLHLISKVCSNHHRGPTFFSKIERILQLFKDDIKKYYSNSTIFNIFKENKQIILFLIKEKIMIMDKHVIKKIINEKYIQMKYPQFFAPEIKPYLNEKWFPKPDSSNKWIEEIKNELPENFFELREIGENENLLCKLIQKDSIKEFIVFLNKNYISPKSKIKPSIYETNSLLIKKQIAIENDYFMFINNRNIDNDVISLIEYAAFFGSNQIINYLKNEGVELTPSLWLYAIHSQNAELIHLLEDNSVEPTVFDKSYTECFYESIKCHHNDVANFFLINYLQNNDEKSNDTFIQNLKYYNFAFLQDENINESILCDLCKYDYYHFVDNLIKSKVIEDMSEAI